MGKLKEVYREVMPMGLRKPILGIMKQIELACITLAYKIGKYDKNLEEEIQYVVRNHKISVFPYKWQEEYRTDNITVYIDEEKNMKYVLRNGKRLYFPRNYSIDMVKETYLNLLIEQDKRSPHLYLTENSGGGY
jgi:hypothetical protein